MKFPTQAVHKGVRKDGPYGSVITPIYATSTFVYESLGKTSGYDYTRSGNPTRRALEENLAALEHGTRAWATCSGIAAETTVMFLFKPGDHIIAPREVYGGTFRLFSSVFKGMGMEFSFVDMAIPQNVAEAVKPNTRCVWIETPSNPLLSLTDIRAVCAIAQERGLMTVADNTFMSPYFQKPLDLGVDIVVHSTTKYLNGHSDVVGGAIIAGPRGRADEVGFFVNALGTGQSPMDAWLVLRGVKTLPQRMKAHQANALAVAHFLESHSRVLRVYYPGLEMHPQHQLAQEQMSGFGGMVSFDLDTHEANVSEVLSRFKVFTFAVSLGGVESLVEHPWTMSHAAMTDEARREAGISEGTLRLSVGLEDVEDLLEDLRQALD